MALHNTDESYMGGKNVTVVVEEDHSSWAPYLALWAVVSLSSKNAILLLLLLTTLTTLKWRATVLLLHLWLQGNYCNIFMDRVEEHLKYAKFSLQQRGTNSHIFHTSPILLVICLQFCFSQLPEV